MLRNEATVRADTEKKRQGERIITTAATASLDEQTQESSKDVRIMLLPGGVWRIFRASLSPENHKSRDTWVVRRLLQEQRQRKNRLGPDVRFV